MSEHIARVNGHSDARRRSRDSTSVECLFSITPPPGRVLLNEGVPGITGWPVSMAAAANEIIGKKRP